MTGLVVEIRRKAFALPVTGAEKVALEDLRFTVPERQFACVIGPSGCGKTTMLNIVAGLDRELEGSIRFGEGGDAARPRCGYVFQAPRLMPWLSVLDNVRLVLKDGEQAERARGLLGEMGLEEVLDQYPNRLSGGMQRRVALARAFAVEPKLLLLDEPFVSLDEPAADHLRGLLLALWQRHPTTILFVTHNLREALQLGDRVLFMSGSPGRIVLDFPVELARPRRPGSSAIEALRHRLLSEHPDLLAGLPPGEPTRLGG